MTKETSMNTEKKLWLSLIAFSLFAILFSTWIFHRSTIHENLSFDNTVALETTELSENGVKTETIIDGYSGFLLLDKNDSPKVALHIENEMRWAMKKYQKLHPDKPLPHITPHVFRHTFCTNMANAGMDIKTLQYVMGHSDVGVTLNVYTHASYDRAAEQMAKIIDFKGLAAPEPQRKSG